MTEYRGKPILVSVDEINRKLEQLLSNGSNFSKDFQFRPKQRMAIVKIAFLYLNNICKNVILDAPTGSGKSIIAIAAARLLREWKKEGYIITSNLDLQDQYIKDIRELSLMWGSIKGVDNYDCHVNGLPFSLGECKTRGYTKEKIEKLECYLSCSYFMNRLKAQHSAISVLNYNYWLIQRNYTAKKNSGDYQIEEAFKKRDFCFFDEAHKMDDIVQSHFSLTINYKLIEKMLEHVEYCDSHKINYDKSILDIAKISLDYTRLMDEEDYAINCKALYNFQKALTELAGTRNSIQDQLKQHSFGKTIPIYLRHALKRCELFKDANCKLEDYLEIISKDEEAFVKTCDSGNNVVTFNLLKDQLLIQNKLHNESNFSVFMSATFGNPKTWAELTGTDDYEIISIPNSWKLKENSPIYLSKKLPTMSYAKRDESVVEIMKELDKILLKNDKVKGVIHTGNFYFNEYIMKNSKYKNRFFAYENSKQRANAIEEFKKSKNGVLVGPSLTEGLDLKDDFSRFQIFIKVPFRVITDNYIKKRMELDTRWYNWKTSLAFIQALGRSIRNENDWAVTYLLDGSFRNYIGRYSNMLPEYVTERIEYF
jgi:Rad3-related DNA helicase